MPFLSPNSGFVLVCGVFFPQTTLILSKRSLKASLANIAELRLCFGNAGGEGLSKGMHRAGKPAGKMGFARRRERERFRVRGEGSWGCVCLISAAG